MTQVEMVVDSLQLSTENYKHVLVLKEKDGKRSLPIFVGLWEAEAISVKLRNMTVPRPDTHDLIWNVMTTMGCIVKSVTLSRFQEDIYRAELLLISSDKLYQLDCRPSDAVAVAIRFSAPIFVDEKLLNEAGMILDPETGKPALDA